MSFFEHPNDLSPGQKVWFMGMKARVSAGYEEELSGFPWKLWAVPIEISGTGRVTVAHIDMLMPRGKKKR